MAAMAASGVKMNWEMVGAIAEMLGAFGVIASLLYLASQLRSNAVASAVDAKLTTTRFMTEFNRDLINDPRLYELWEKGSKNPSILSREEYVRFANLNFNSFWYLSAGHYQLRVGRLDLEDFHEMESIMEFWMSREGVKEWWMKHGRQRYNKHFVEYLEKRYLDGRPPDK